MYEKAREIAQKLETRRPLLPLTPQAPVDLDLEEAIEALLAHGGGTGKPNDRLLAVVAGLHLWNGSLDRSHTISQDIENATGSYWHGIMHRMEGDYWNAKYWFRRVGAHPAMRQLQAEAARRLADAQLKNLPHSSAADRLQAAARGGDWDAAAFVDAVEAQQHGRGGEETRALLESLQHLELSVLTAYCIAAAERED